jgi:hypothetical protein
MIANASLYSISPAVTQLWRELFGKIANRTPLPLTYLDLPESRPMAQVWARTDKAAVFMCGLAYARSTPRPILVAAPVPLPADFEGQPQHWSDLVVRADSSCEKLDDTFGQRIAFTTPDSYAGCWAALHHLMDAGARRPPYREIIAPQITATRAMLAVVEGAADVAPIDSYAHCLLHLYRPDLTSRVRVIAQTARTAISPIVASYAGRLSLEPLLLDAHTIPVTRSLLTALMIERFVHMDAGSYDILRARFETARAFWRKHPPAAHMHAAFAPYFM